MTEPESRAGRGRNWGRFSGLAASILTEASPISGESHWDQDVELSTSQVVVHCDYMP